MCHGRRSRARVFVQTPYVASAEGVALRAVLPQRCPFAQPGDGACDVRVHHERPRTTGPCFALAVVRCSTHPAHAFTLYPPGHVPYGRVAMTPASTAGALLLDSHSGEPAWGATVFRATLDVAGGERWPGDSPASDLRRRRTQGRRLEVAGRLTGIHPVFVDAVREQIATRLGVATMTLRTAAQAWGAACDWTARADAVLLVVAKVPVTAVLPDRLLSAGALADLWPSPRRWDQSRAALLCGPFQRARSATSLCSDARAPPATTSPAESSEQVAHGRARG